MKCSKCSGEMEEGIVAPRATTVPMKKITHKLNWGKMLTGNIMLGFDLQDSREIKVYKCISCGYMESYAK